MRGKDLFDQRSMHDIVLTVMDRLGHSAPIRDVVLGVRKTATKDEWEIAADGAMTALVRSELRRSEADEILPAYLQVDGVYKALRLFDPREYEEKARLYAKAGRQNKDRVFQLRDACEQAHGKTFDADAIILEFGLAS